MSGTLLPPFASFASGLGSFLGGEMKCLTINLKEGLFLLSVQGVQSLVIGKSWWQGSEAAGHLVCTPR